MIIAKFKGGMFGEGCGEVLRCCLCGDHNYENLIVQRLGIAVGMAGDDYTFCKKCWFGKNFGKRLLQFLDYPGGMYINENDLDFTDVQDER